MMIIKTFLKAVAIIFFAVVFSSCLSNNYEINYITKRFNAEIVLDASYKKEINNNFVIDSLFQDSIHIKKVFQKDSTPVSSIRYVKISDTNDLGIEIEVTRYIGENVYWHPNGTLKEIVSYIDNDFLWDEVKTYYENGIMRRHDYFKLAVLDSGKCFDSLGNEIEHFPYSIEPVIDLKQFSNMLIYPEHLRRKGIQENIYIRVLVDSDGTIIKFRYDKSHSQGFINSIRNALISYGKMQHAEQDGYPVQCWVTMPVIFRLR